MRRREFIAGLGATAWPLMARAQQAIPVVGFLRPTSLADSMDYVAAFRQGLKESGFIEGQNVVIEYRWAEGQSDRLPALAAELVRREVAVLSAIGSESAVAAKSATSNTPIVFAGASNPIAIGLVASLNRPGGNVTGVTMASHELGPKTLELLRQLIPQLANVALLVNPHNPSAKTEIENMQMASRALGVRLQIVNASNDREIDTAFTTISEHRGQALVVVGDPLWSAQGKRVVSLAARQNIPTSYPLREYPLAGGLMSYGASFTDAIRQTGVYVGRVLKGEKPADLPVMQSTKFEFVINLKTAAALRLTVPDKVLALADEVIE